MTMDHNDRRRVMGSLALASMGMAAFSTASAAPAARRRASLEERLDRLESHREIEAVLYRYARGWDRYDEDALRSCFWADATHEHGTFKGKSQDFIGKAWPYIGTIVLTMHAISNVQIVIDGDRAISECYFAAHHQRANSMKNSDEDFFLWGRYIDRHLRRGDEWKIIHRQGLTDAEQLFPQHPHMAKLPAEQLSRRKPDDPFYAAMAAFQAGH